MGRSRGRAVLRVLVVVVGLAGSATGVLFIPRDTPPAPTDLEPARSTLQRALDQDGGRWAGREVAQAREAVESAERAFSRENARLPLLRDSAPVRGAIRAADEACTGALQATLAARQAALQESESLIAEAGQALQSARDLAEAIRLGSRGRVALKKAEVALNEAHRYHARGAWPEAVVKARWVIEQSAQWEQRSFDILGRFRREGSLRVWRRWVAETIARSADSGDEAIIVDKAARLLLLYRGGRLERSWPVDLGRNPIADKVSEGDNATPEGKYSVVRVKGPGQSRYYRALLLNYPNEDDWETFRRARSEGRIPRGVGIGSLIEIHGEGGRGDNWTRGCIALANSDIDYLATHVGVGTPVTIVGARAPVPVPELRARLAADRVAGSATGSGSGHP
jgi:L,D-transpeptidase-like protein